MTQVPTQQTFVDAYASEAPWDINRINAHRLEWLQSDPTTKYRQDGVIAIDNTLIDHDGKLIDDVGKNLIMLVQQFVNIVEFRAFYVPVIELRLGQQHVVVGHL